MEHPDPGIIRRELTMRIFRDGSIEILNGKGEAISFFADDVIAPAIIMNLEELGEL